MQGADPSEADHRFLADPAQVMAPRMRFIAMLTSDGIHPSDHRFPLPGAGHMLWALVPDGMDRWHRIVSDVLRNR